MGADGTGPVRVAVVGPAKNGHIGPSLADGFAALGHQAVMLDESRLVDGSGGVSRSRRLRVDRPLTSLAGRVLVRRVAEHEAQMIVVVKGQFIDSGTVAAMGAGTGALIVNWCPDDPTYASFRDRRWLAALRGYDHVVVWAEAIAARLLAEGINAATIPFGYDPSWYAPGQASERWDVAFVGQWSQKRETYVRAMTGLRLAVAGSGWQQAFGRSELAAAVIPGDHFGAAAAEIYRSAKVGLNILHPQNRGTHNMRTWELPAVATATVMCDSDDHRRIFADGGAVLVGSPEAMAEQVRGLLADERRRDSVLRKGRAAVADGTYAARVSALLALVEGGGRCA